MFRQIDGHQRCIYLDGEAALIVEDLLSECERIVRAVLESSWPRRLLKHDADDLELVTELVRSFPLLGDPVQVHDHTI